MKRFIQWLLIVGVLYFSYQGWQKFLHEEDRTFSSGEMIVEEAKQSTIETKITEVVAELQSSVASFLSEDTEHNVPAVEAKLTTSDDVVVNEIAQFLYTRTPSFVVRIYGEREVVSQSMEDWIEEALRKDDYIRYALHGYTYSILSYSQYSEVKFELNYRETEEQTNYVRAYVQNLLQEHQVVSMSDREKIKWIHDWVVTHVQYDQTLTKYTAYEALTEKSAVCQGYALLGEMMFQEVGLESRIAEGEVATGSHAWNMVKLDEQWYHIDLTWDDPIGHAEDEISYSYYLVSDSSLKLDHSWTKVYPVANAEYKDILNEQIELASTEEREQLILFRESLHLHWFEEEYTLENREALTQKVKRVTKSKDTTFSFRYLDTETLIADLNHAFQASNIGLSYNVQYKPLTAEGDSLVTVALTYN